MTRFSKLYLVLKLVLAFSMGAAFAEEANPYLLQRTFTNAMGVETSVNVYLPYQAKKENTYEISKESPLKDFEKAVKEIKAKDQAAKIVFEPGVYELPNTDKNAYFDLRAVNNVTIDGAGAELRFHQIKRVFVVNDSLRVAIKNFTFNSQVRNASRGVIRYIDGRKSIQINDAYAKEFNLHKNTYRKVTTVYPANPNAKGPFQYKYAIKHNWHIKKGIENPYMYFNYDASKKAYIPYNKSTLRDFKYGEPVIIKHSEYEATGIVVRNTNQITITDNTFHDINGMGINVAKANVGVNVSRNKISIDPRDRLSVVGAAADGLNIGQVKRNIIVEGNNFSTTGDDALNIHGRFWRVVSVLGPNKIRIEMAFKNHTYYEGIEDEILEFFKEDLTHKANAKLSSSKRLENNIMEVTLDRNMNLKAGDLINRLEWQPKRVYVAGNFFHNLWARGALIMCRNGIFTKNRIINTSGAAILLKSEHETFDSAGPVRNFIVSNNFIRAVAHGSTGSMAAASSSIDIGAITVSAKIKRLIDPKRHSPNTKFHGPFLEIKNNIISKVPGPAIMVSSATGVKVHDNKIHDAHYMPQAVSRTGMDNGLYTHDKAIFTSRISKCHFSNN